MSAGVKHASRPSGFRVCFGSAPGCETAMRRASSNMAMIHEPSEGSSTAENSANDSSSLPGRDPGRESGLLSRLSVRLSLSRRFSSRRSSARPASMVDRPSSRSTPRSPSKSKVTLQHGMEVDTVGDGMSDARLVDTTGDGRPDTILYLEGEGSAAASPSPRRSSVEPAGWWRWRRRRPSVARQSIVEQQSDPVDADAQARARRRAIVAAVADDARIPWASVLVGDTIGWGASGMVCRGEFASTPVAVKILHSKQVNDTALQQLAQECQLMLQLRHPNVLMTIGTKTATHARHNWVSRVLRYYVEPMCCVIFIRIIR